MFKLKKNLILYILVGSIVVFSFLAGINYGKVIAADNLEEKLKVFIQVLDIVKNDYVEKNLDDTKLVYGAIRGLLESLDDPYTRFMDPNSYKEMTIRLSGIYSGVGIYIGIKDKQLTVIAPIEDTPAARAGIQAGDKIVKINGKSTKDMALEEAVGLIRGPKGTIVTLSILRGKEKDPKDYKLIREKIVIKSLEKKMLRGEIGYIKLNTFENKNAAADMKNALEWVKNKKAKGLILDLRGNGGGLLQNAIEIADMFISEGIIVSTVGREGEIETIKTQRGVLWDKPLVVVIDNTSASASEILAGALQDNKVGVVVGIHSFGKASVQNVRQLRDGSALLLTVAKYKTPSGRDISEKGIEPNVMVEIPTAEAVSGADPQLKRALEIIEEKINLK